MNPKLPIPSNETERLIALKDYELLDSINEKEFDRLTELASLICGVPIALVSLIDKDRQWFKSKIGLNVNETPRDISFCQFAIMEEKIFEVNDASLDDRFRDNPLVTGSPDIKFYAGYPLIDPNGYALGTLCVIDREPKKLTKDQERALSILGQEVVSQILARRDKKELYDFSQLFLSSIDMVCVAKTDGYFKRINPAFSQSLGYTEKEILSTPFIEFVHPEDVDKTIAEVGKLSKGLKTINFTNRYKKKNGEYIILDWVSNPDPITGNLYSIARDISPIKKTEQELLKLTNFQNAILNGTDYSIISTNPEGIITSFNKGAEEMLGYSAEELINKTSPAILHDLNEVVARAKTLTHELKTIVEPGFEAFVAKSKLGKPDVNEWTYIKKTGERIKVQLSVTTLFNANKEVFGYLGIARDITQIKKNEELLKLSEEKHRLFFENAQGLMCTHDKNGKFLSMNAAGAQLIGYTPQELLSKSLLDVTPKEFVGRVTNYLKNIFEKGYDEGLMKVVHKDGSIKVWFYKNVLIKDTNGDSVAIGNAIDISNRIEIERELKKAKLVAEKSVIAKDQFLANMSHEIRTPMNAILGFTDILLATNLDNNQKDYLKAINNSGENLMVIINDILDFSKIESGNLSLESNVVDLHALLDNCKKLLSHKAKEHNLDFNFYIDSETPKFIISDNVRLNQILINLLGNAIKFTEQGKVELFCKPEQRTNTECSIIFTIKDTGIGIPKEKQDVIFERFKQADDNTTRKFGGTGLGLSITKKLISLFGGKLSLKSELGKGSEFSVQIPFKISKLIEEQPIIEDEENKTKRTLEVLLVEDNDLNQKLAKHILESNGLTVEIADNGQLAIDALKNKIYDIILMDLQMPVMDGYVATAFIRNVLKISTPMIAMTAHSLIGEKEKCLQIGMNDYISKPYKAKELIGKINNLFNHKTGYSHLSLKEAETGNIKLYGMEDVIELSNNDQRFVNEMINIFINDVPLEVAKFGKLISETNLEEIHRIAHKIKSSYSVFMADACVDSCSKIENEQTQETIKEHVALLIKYTPLIIEGLKKEIR